MTEYVHPATGETGHRGELARQAEVYFTSLPSKVFSIESLEKLTNTKSYLCKNCALGNHGSCKGTPAATQQYWTEVDGVRTLAYYQGASSTPWQKETNTREPYRWDLYGQVFTETLQCQCAVHDHPWAVHPSYENMCLAETQGDWGNSICGKPPKGVAMRNWQGRVMLDEEPQTGTGWSEQWAVPMCGIHLGVKTRGLRAREQRRAAAKARETKDERDAANRKAAEHWAERLTELTGVEFRRAALGIKVEVGPELLWKVLQEADDEMRASLGFGLRKEEDDES